MLVLVVPDIHQNLRFLQAVLDVEDPARFDRLVFLGDYFDAREADWEGAAAAGAAADAVLALKRELGDRVCLLCGNHDLPYYALRPACGAGHGRPNLTIGQWMLESSFSSAQAINAAWDEAFWSGLDLVATVDGWLFSHAGVHAHWWPVRGGSVEEKAAQLNARWRDAVTAMFWEEENPLFGAGPARGGNNDVGGPLWLDWDEEFADALEVPQIVGHTRFPREPRKGRSLCIDFMQSVYAVVSDGEVTLKSVDRA